MSSIVDNWLKIKSWKEPNAAQKIALENGLLSTDNNLVIIAPTASGKTGIAELATLQTIENSKRVLYLVPLKALVSEKEKDFKKLLPSCKVAGANDNPNNWDKADVVISTFEVFYRTALTKPDYVRNFSLAIVDEFHLLYDKLRGFTLEKVITALKEFNPRLICLSATFEDKNEIAEWLKAKVIEIPSEARPVPIRHYIIKLESKKGVNTELCKRLIEMDQSPYIIFCTSKYSCQLRAKEMCNQLTPNEETKSVVLSDFQAILERQKLLESEQELLDCISRRVAFHHSDVNQKLKDYVENLYCKRGIDYLFATTGLAYGINFPAKAIVLADLSFYDPNSPSKRSDVPVFMYKQMAGRAGRPGLENEAYSYVVTKNSIELNYKAPEYIRGKIERAVSQIGQDEYFRKAILEIIYSGRNTNERIIGFFEGTFFNYQSNKIQKSLLKYDLHDSIKKQMTWLNDNGLVDYMGVAGYKLTDFGKVVVSFLFWSYSSYELEPFVELKKFLDNEKLVEPEFELIYLISRLFEGVCLSKIPRKTSSEIEEYFANMGISEIDNPEYSAYAIFNGWMENKDVFEIEEKLCVNTSQLQAVASELSKLLKIYETLARRLGYEVSPSFRDFSERVRRGVTEEELPFAKLKGIGRETTRELTNYANSLLKGPNFNYTGTLLQVLKKLLKDVGDERFMNTHMQYIANVGPARSKSLLDFVKQSPETI
jgi:helicase